MIKTSKKPLPHWLWWGLGTLAALAAAAGLGYYWRVFYYLDARGVSGTKLTVLLCGLALLAVAAVAAVKRLKTFAGRGAACIFLCGLVFVFASAPLQAPDEVQHYLRAYSISQGHFDFDAEREYPADVAKLTECFPGAWVNGHVSKGLTVEPYTGDESVYDTTGYALKKYGENGRVIGIADAFAAYRNGEPAKQSVKEPVLFMVLPFVPQAAGIWLARLLGLNALACLYAGRIANLLVYALICRAALRRCGGHGPLFLAVALCPLSLYMAASMSYDAQLLACYYLMAALFAGGKFGKSELLFYLAAFGWANMAKPWINLLWLALPLLLRRENWRAPLKKWQFALLALVLALGINALVEWYGSAFRYNYGTIGRMLDDVDQVPQLKFVLSNPLRFAAVLLGTLYENDFFIGQLGLFGNLDLPVSAINTTAGAMLLLGAVLGESRKPQTGLLCRAGAPVWGVVYAAGCMAAMYITYTPVGMIRVIGLQARYFLPVFLLALWALAEALGLKPRSAAKNQNIALAVFAAYGALGGLLVFQHMFIGPVYTIGQ